MKDLLAGIVRQLVDIKATVSLMPSLRWATVTQASPLRITLDGDAMALADSPFCLIPKPKTGDRVSVIVANRRATIIGTPGGGKLFIPPGIVSEFAGTSPPPGWLLCDGHQVRVSDYPELYAVIGRTYGGNGEYFGLPDHRGRVGVGISPTSSDFNHLGKTGGSSTHTLTVAEMPSHTHGTRGGWGAGSMGIGFFRTDQNNPRTRWAESDPVGGSRPHNNLQPYLVTNFIIKT